MGQITPTELTARITSLGKDIPEELKKSVLKAAQNIEAEAKRYCTPGKSPYKKAPYSDDNDPRRQPPHMRDVMYSKVVEGKRIQAVVGNTKSYAFHVHQGTSKMPARPFIMDAVKAKVGDTNAFLKDGVKNALMKAIKK